MATVDLPPRRMIVLRLIIIVGAGPVHLPDAAAVVGVAGAAGVDLLDAAEVVAVAVVGVDPVRQHSDVGPDHHHDVVVDPEAGAGADPEADHHQG